MPALPREGLFERLEYSRYELTDRGAGGHQRRPHPDVSPTGKRVVRERWRVAPSSSVDPCSVSSKGSWLAILRSRQHKLRLGPRPFCAPPAPPEIQWAAKKIHFRARSCL